MKSVVSLKSVISMFICAGLVFALTCHAEGEQELLDREFSRITRPPPPMPTTQTARSRVHILLSNLLNKLDHSYLASSPDYLYRNHRGEESLLQQTITDTVDFHEYVRGVYDKMPATDEPISQREEKLSSEVDRLPSAMWLIHYNFILNLDQLYMKSFDYRYANEFMYASQPRRPHHYIDGLATRSSSSARATRLIEAVVAKMRRSVKDASAKISEAIHIAIKGELSEAELVTTVGAIISVNDHLGQIQKILLEASQRAKDIGRQANGNVDKTEHSIAQLGQQLHFDLNHEPYKSNNDRAELAIFKYILTTGAVISGLQAPQPVFENAFTRLSGRIRLQIASRLSASAASGLPATRAAALPALASNKANTSDLELKLWQTFFDNADIDFTAMTDCRFQLGGQ